jgi:hypothetical protein
MEWHVRKEHGLKARRMIFAGRKVGKVRVFTKSGSHRGQRVKLDDGKCWIEREIDLP